jgi:DNA polymerase-3 subunit beta
MKVEVTQENLARALSNVGRVASTRAGLEILSNILIRTDGKQLLLAATNLEIAATERIGAKITTQGSITVPAKLINDFIHNHPKEKITLEVSGNTLQIKSPSNTSTINGTRDDEFPELPIIDETSAVSLSLPALTFKQAASQTVIAASSDSTRPVLTGIYWHVVDGELYMAATDGYRLAEKKVGAVDVAISAIIPTSTIQEVTRTISDDSTDIDLLLDETQVRFRMGENEITSRLIDGNFPDYRQLIPSSSATNFSTEKQALIQAAKLASLFSNGSGGNISIKTEANENKTTISSVASEYGDNTSTLPTQSLSGDDASVSINSRYLLEALAAIDDDTVAFGFSGKLAPCVVRPTNNKENYTHIIMPIKS